MKVGLAQINTVVGDIPGNETKIRQAYCRGAEMGLDLVMFPELALAGYPPRDLLLNRRFIELNLVARDRLAAATGRTGLLFGYVGRNESRPGREATNAAALCHEGQIVATRDKTLLPTYDVFDEDRYFEPATGNEPISWKGLRLGVTICEDVWNDEEVWHDHRRYRMDPARQLAAAGVDLMFNISASPWCLGKNEVRRRLLGSLASSIRCPVFYCNLVGGNDELIFDGASLVFDAQGNLAAHGARFAEDFMVVDTDRLTSVTPPVMGEEESAYRAMVLGLRDYLHKCGFKSAVLGLSGGIDSALTAVVAAEALGPENVMGVSLPSQFSSQHSLDDARDLALRLGIRYEVLPIGPVFESAKSQLADVFKGLAEDTTEENMQARIRGMLLMALSNKFGSLLLTTGNKSELAVGYCTIYGDMCGGLAVISDLPKTMVYRVSSWVNREREIIPQSSITKPPSAELRPNQTDQDSLPPYEVLDQILDLYVVQMRSSAEIIAAGFDEVTVRKIVRLIDLSEYKRRQAAPGLKITTKAFGMGRRIPIAQRFRC